MSNTHIDKDDTMRSNCIRCGEKIRLLWDGPTMIQFISQPQAQRRAFQCKNCGQIICYHCSSTARQCQCKSNAWAALPCMEHPGHHRHPDPDFIWIA